MRFLLSALPVEGDEPGQDLLLAEVGRPAIGGGDGGIERFVMFVEDHDEAAIAYIHFRAFQRVSGEERLAHIVKLGQCQAGVFQQDLLAYGV